MDQIDKDIMFRLLVNCRTSYQALAKKLNLSVNAVKKRIDKLKEAGLIKGYQILPSLAMLDAETTLAVLKLKDPTPDEVLLDTIGAHPSIYAASMLTNGSVLCFGHYRESKDLDELGTFLRQVEKVEDVEFHTLLSEKGNKCELKTAHLKVLRCLCEDARMPIAEIAQKTRLTPRRIRKVLRELTCEGGSEPATYLRGGTPSDIRTMQSSFNFRILWDLNAGENTAIIIRINHEEGTEKRGKVINWLKKRFPLKFWYAYTSAFEPIIFSVFVIEHMRQAQKILREIQQESDVLFAKVMYGYPTRRYTGFTETFFEKILKNTDPSLKQ